jgi:hypothetical protein
MEYPMTQSKICRYPDVHEQHNTTQHKTRKKTMMYEHPIEQAQIEKEAR